MYRIEKEMLPDAVVEKIEELQNMLVLHTDYKGAQITYEDNQIMIDVHVAPFAEEQND